MGLTAPPMSHQIKCIMCIKCIIKQKQNLVLELNTKLEVCCCFTKPDLTWVPTIVSNFAHGSVIQCKTRERSWARKSPKAPSSPRPQTTYYRPLCPDLNTPTKHAATQLMLWVPILSVSVQASASYSDTSDAQNKTLRTLVCDKTCFSSRHCLHIFAQSNESM